MERIECIAFELSNRCNMAALHPECPTKAKADPIFLPTQIVLEVIDYMGYHGWEGNFYFNVYNEPMIDPRLYYFCEYVRDHSKAAVQIYTNGWYLNEQLFQEMMFRYRIGFTVSAYSDSEEERLRKIEGLNVHRINLDNRMDIYNHPPTAKGPCLAPTVYPIINHRAELVYCCMDYEYRNVIANLNKVPFHIAIESVKRKKICVDLINGIRNTYTCQQCPHIGWGISSEEWSEWQ